jgi:DNA invertase Pin-like site-specific DNA recombinase
MRRGRAPAPAARARGHKGGRRPKLAPDQQQLACQLAASGIPITTIAQTLHYDRHTVYKALAQLGRLAEAAD